MSQKYKYHRLILRQSLILVATTLIISGCGMKPGDIDITRDAYHAFKHGGITILSGVELLKSGDLSGERDFLYLFIFYPKNLSVIGGGGSFKKDDVIVTDDRTYRIQLYPPNDYEKIKDEKFSFTFDQK